MKRLLALVLAVVLIACSLTACGGPDPSIKSEGVMTYEEYMAAEVGDDVVIEAYVQATQAWWEGKTGTGVITAYLADPDGAYFVYEMACSEENAAKLTKGTKIKVTGEKAEWDGEVEIMNATFEFGDNVVCSLQAKDVTSLMGKDELIDSMNQLIALKGVTVKAQDGGAAFTYQGGNRGKDIYLTVEKDGKTMDLCVESYLTNPDSDLYKAVEELKVGDVIDVEGFLYWYNGANPHVTKVTVKK